METPTANSQSMNPPLSQDEQRILEVLAILYEPVEQIQLQQVLEQLKWQDAQNRPLESLLSKKLRDKWIHQRLITFKQKKLRCPPQIADHLAISAARDPSTYAAICKAIEKIFPASSGYYYYGYYSQELLQARENRTLRIPLFQGNAKKLFQELDAQALADNPFSTPSPLITHKLSRLLTLPLDEAWLGQQPESIRFQLLYAFLQNSNLALQEQNSLYQLFEQYFSAQAKSYPVIAHTLAEHKLLRADLDAVPELLDQDASHTSLALLGWYHFLQGRYEESIEYYQRSLKAKKKLTRKRNVIISGRPGVFFLLALIQSGEAAHYHLLKEQLVLAAKSADFDLDPDAPVMRLIMETADIAQGTLSFQKSVWFEKTDVLELSYAPLLHLIYALALFWLEQPAKLQPYSAKLTRYCKQSFDTGYLWYAFEYVRLLQAIEEAEKEAECACPEILEQAQQNTSVVPITGLVRVKTFWEWALQELRNVGGLQPDDSLPTSVSMPDTRLAWHLEYVELSNGFCACSLQPREQKRTKRGAWTKGRPVALKRLYEESESIDYLTPQDRQICLAITLERAVSFYGYGREHYILNTEKALLAAVKHPYLYWIEQIDNPVELVQSEPQLLVRTQDQKINIDITPVPNLLRDGELLPIHLQKETSHRLRLTHFSQQHLRIQTILGEKGLTAPQSAKNQILESIASIAPILTIHSDIEGHNIQAAQPVEADPRIHIHLQPAGDGLKISACVQPFPGGGPQFKPGQGGTTLFAEIDGQRLQTTRDLNQEKTRAQSLLQACPQLAQENGTDDFEWVLEDPESSLEALHYLQNQGEDLVLSWPQGKALRLSSEINLSQMSVKVRKERDWFELNGQLKIDEDNLLSMERLLELTQATPGRFVRLDNNSILVLSKELKKRLDAWQAYSDKGKFHLLASPLIDEITDGMDIKSSKQWKAQLARFEESQQLTPQTPSTLQARLRDYQIEGFHWLWRLAHWGAGACLADDMGLGKTIQTLTLILTRAPDGPTLILAPTSVCINWMEEAVRFTPTLNAKLFGTGNREQMLKEAGAYDLIVCSYGLLQTEAERLSQTHWHTIVADEAQALKNPQTKRTKAAMMLTGDFKMITTGTPIENHLGELWSLFRFINPGLLGSQDRFNQRFAGPIENQNDASARQHLKLLTRPFILRRLKSEVLTELPPRTEITLHVELSEEEIAFYEALRRQALKRINEPTELSGPQAVAQQKVKILAELMKLRRACCNPKMILPDTHISSSKLKVFGDIVEELLDNNHKALVFSQFVDHLKLIRDYLDQKKIAYQYLDGSTPQAKRKLAVNEFQAGCGDLFLISLKAGGTGLNLTAADYVIHMDPWWNPAVEDQASDRAHRLGQQRPVTVYRLVTTQTIEDKIVDLHAHKRDLANSLLEGTEVAGSLSVEDMMNLIEA